MVAGVAHDLTGRKFGRLSVVEKTKKRRNSCIVWLCLCDCGNTKEITGTAMVRGFTRSCGCLNREMVNAASTTHGLTGHPLHAVWFSMKQRCFNLKANQYDDYGGRGITICDEWAGSFGNFYKWAMSAGWKPGLELDRRNNNGDYTSCNCRFVSSAKNNANQRLLTKANSSGFRGVYFFNGRWSAYYYKNYKQVRIGAYGNAKYAAICRDRAVVDAGIDLPLNYPELFFNISV